MRVLNFSDFVSVNESSNSLKAELIGDSSVGLYKSLVPNASISFPGLNKSGWSTSDLLAALRSERSSNPEARLVFIGIGSNDLYQITPKVQRNAKEIRKELARVFPNAEYIVIKGGWGWGGLSDFSGTSEPQDLKDYYRQVWEDAGFRVMHQSQGYSPEHHTSSHPGIRRQASEISSIISGRTGIYDVTSGGVFSPEESLEHFYDGLEQFANSGKNLSQQVSGGFLFDPVVQRIQLGLEFLDIELPRFGADGLYGPETAASVQEFKQQNGLSGDGSSFGPDDMVALISQLKNGGFSSDDLDLIQKKSDDLLSQGDLTSGDNEYLFYLQHQQGAAGAASLIKAASGQGDLHPSTRANSGRFLTQNMPDKGIADQISAAVNSGDDQRAAVLFLNYWKKFWDGKKKQALDLISQGRYAGIKASIDAVPSSLPKDFLYTVAFIESGFDPKAGSGGRYKGLFAITDANLKKYVPSGDIYDPEDNAQAAIRDMEGNIKTFKNLAGSSLSPSSGFA
jgi:hypothetical protein